MAEQEDIITKPKPTINVNSVSLNSIDMEYGKCIRESLKTFNSDVRYSVLGDVLPGYRLGYRYRKKGDPCFLDSLRDSEIDLLLKNV